MAMVDERPSLEQQAGQYAIRGAVLGFILVLAAVTIIAITQGESSGGSIGLGLFVALWGGSGFGAMMGAAVAAMRNTSWFE